MTGWGEERRSHRHRNCFAKVVAILRGHGRSIVGIARSDLKMDHYTAHHVEVWGCEVIALAGRFEVPEGSPTPGVAEVSWRRPIRSRWPFPRTASNLGSFRLRKARRARQVVARHALGFPHVAPERRQRSQAPDDTEVQRRSGRNRLLEVQLRRRQSCSAVCRVVRSSVSGTIECWSGQRSLPPRSCGAQVPIIFGYGQVGSPTDCRPDPSVIRMYDVESNGTIGEAPEYVHRARNTR